MLVAFLRMNHSMFSHVHNFFRKMIIDSLCRVFLRSVSGEYASLITKFITDNPLQPDIAFLYPHENIRKPFSGGIEKQQWTVMG